MYSVFISSNIVIKGALTYKLKDIANAMFENGLIKTKWKEGGVIKDGLDAMTQAVQYYQNKDKKILSEIIEYNKIDCKVIWDIVSCLRSRT